MDIKIFPSILSADFANIAKEVHLLEESGADGIQPDPDRPSGWQLHPSALSAERVGRTIPLFERPLRDVFAARDHRAQLRWGADFSVCVATEQCDLAVGDVCRLSGRRTRGTLWSPGNLSLSFAPSAHNIARRRA